MKTFLPSSIRTFLFAFTMVVLAGNLTMQNAYAQTAVLTSMPTATGTNEKDNAAATKSSIGFQSTAFPIGNTGKVKVIFDDPTGNGAAIVIRNKNGSIVHSKNYKNIASHKSNLDLSKLPDGAYAVEIIALTKAGFNKQKATYTFQIQCTTNRSFIPVNKEMEKKLFTPRHYQVKR
jgi:hypothetical protein